MTGITEIIEIKEPSPEHADAIQRLLAQLTDRPVQITEQQLTYILSQENTHLFLLLSRHTVAGMLTVGTYYSPTGGKAWIEDVVVDKDHRGQGLGRLLVEHAIRFVKEQGISLLMLTSNPTRVAANKLYQSLGFERKQTNVYRMTP